MKQHIYLLEDNVDIKDMIKYLLAGYGYKVSGLATIKEFDDQLANELPDLFILDIMLPGGNGVDICNRLKADKRTQDIPVLLMSANLKFKLEDSIAEDFIGKPFDINEFLMKIERLLPKIRA